MRMKSTRVKTPAALVAMLLLMLGVIGACSSGGPEDVDSRGSGLTKGTPGAQNGDEDYCDDPLNLCAAGEGDCDLTAQCV
jgi:hypothetical protein